MLQGTSPGCMEPEPRTDTQRLVLEVLWAPGMDPPSRPERTAIGSFSTYWPI